MNNTFYAYSGWHGVKKGTSRGAQEPATRSPAESQNSPGNGNDRILRWFWNVRNERRFFERFGIATTGEDVNIYIGKYIFLFFRFYSRSSMFGKRNGYNSDLSDRFISRFSTSFS